MAVDKNDGTVHLPRPPIVKKHPGGRPSKLTEEMIERIRVGMASGAYIETAAAQAGVASETLRDWLRKGAAGKSALHRKFSATMEKAEAEAEMRALATVQEFGRGMFVEVVTVTTKGTGASAVTETKTERRPVREWTAAAWYLERRRPARWGRRVVELQGAGGTPIGSTAVSIYLPDNGRGGTDAEANELPEAVRNRGNGSGQH